MGDTQRDRYKDQPGLARAAECACTYSLTDGFCSPRNRQQCKCWDRAEATMKATGLSARAAGWIFAHLQKIETQAEADETRIWGGTPHWSKAEGSLAGEEQVRSAGAAGTSEPSSRVPPPGVETEGVEAARKVIAVMKSIAGKRLAIKFPDDETALQITTIVENAGKVARALLSTSSRGEGSGSLAMTPASLPASDGRPSVAAHTAGPWFVRDFRATEMRRLGWKGPAIDRILITNKDGPDIEASSGANCVVARIQFDNRSEELGETSMADARLIAAAPDLFELAKRARQKLATYQHVYAGDKELRGLLADWDAVITKATVGSQASE